MCGRTALSRAGDAIADLKDGRGAVDALVLSSSRRASKQAITNVCKFPRSTVSTFQGEGGGYKLEV